MIIQTDSALEARMGRSDIYIHPEEYDHVFTLDPPLPACPGCLIVECDLWRAWIWLGDTWKRKRDAGFSRFGFRRKKPYSRLVPEAVVAREYVDILRYHEGGETFYTLDYHDAVAPRIAVRLAEDPRDLFTCCEQVRVENDPDGKPESYASLLTRAKARVRELNA